MSLEDEVNRHTRCVEVGQPVRYCEACPRCGVCGEFRVHDCRPRTFRLIVEGCVKIFRSGIWRWRCLACGERFTDYPLLPFALPYKRFVTEVVCDRSGSFLGSDQSYRQTVRLQGRAMVYDDRQDEELARQAAALAHSTVWRWLSWLGDELQAAFRAVRQLIRARTSDSTLHRECWGVSPYKYRSETRRLTLQRAVEGLVLAAVFQRLFGKAIFPRYATGGCRR